MDVWVWVRACSYCGCKSPSHTHTILSSHTHTLFLAHTHTHTYTPQVWLRFPSSMDFNSVWPAFMGAAALMAPRLAAESAADKWVPGAGAVGVAGCRLGHRKGR